MRPSAYKNNTLNGALLAWERPEERHLRHKFGYWNMVERRMIRAQLEAEGIEPDEFEIGKRIVANHAGDATYREIGDAWRAECEARARDAFAAGLSVRSIGLTRSELEFLAEHFDGANDPVAAAVLEKVRAALGL